MCHGGTRLALIEAKIRSVQKSKYYLEDKILKTFDVLPEKKLDKFMDREYINA